MTQANYLLTQYNLCKKSVESLETFLQSAKNIHQDVRETLIYLYQNIPAEMVDSFKNPFLEYQDRVQEVEKRVNNNKQFMIDHAMKVMKAIHAFKNQETTKD